MLVYFIASKKNNTLLCVKLTQWVYLTAYDYELQI